MIAPELQAYINQSRAAGRSDDQIKQSLVSSGWLESDIDAGLSGSANNPIIDHALAPASTAGVSTQIQSAGEMDANVYQIFKRNYGRRLIIAGMIVLGLEILWFAYLFAINNFSQGFVEVAFFPILGGVVYFRFAITRAEDAFLQEFAASKGFTFQKSGLPENLDGSLFSIGHSRSGRDLVSGNFQTLPLCLFNYQYTVGYGKGSRTYNYTILRLDYQTPLPPIFLQVAWHNFGESIFSYFSRNDPEKIQLEGNFNNYFTMYTKRGFETEALQILSPEFMAKIQDTWKNFSLELVNNHLYIYAYHRVSTKVELDSMYDLAQYLIQKIQPMASRMNTTLTELEGYYQGK